MTRVLLVFAGSGAGGVLRYLTALASVTLFGPAFPWGTMTVNVLGCFAIGVVMRFATAGVMGEDLRVLLATGVLGGFTTYSSFNYETLTLYQRGTVGAAFAYAAATLVLGLASGLLGQLAAARFTG